MRALERAVEVAAGIQVSSVWAVPERAGGHADTGVVLAHGAGSDMNNPFLSYVHAQLAEADVLTVRFNFPYKERGASAPDRAPVLEATWRALIAAVREDTQLAPRRLFCGGRSMGARVASQVVAAGAECAGLVAFGYPLHPAKRPSALRSAHFSRIRCPMLFIQGTRDALCDLESLRGVLRDVPAPVRVHVIDGADHGFNVPKRLGRSAREIWDEILQVTLRWLREV